MFITALVRRLKNYLISTIKKFENDPADTWPPFYFTDKNLPVNYFTMDRP